MGKAQEWRRKVGVRGSKKKKGSGQAKPEENVLEGGPGRSREGGGKHMGIAEGSWVKRPIGGEKFITQLTEAGVVGKGN